MSKELGRQQVDGSVWPEPPKLTEALSHLAHTSSITELEVYTPQPG